MADDAEPRRADQARLTVNAVAPGLPETALICQNKAVSAARAECAIWPQCRCGGLPTRRKSRSNLRSRYLMTQQSSPVETLLVDGGASKSPLEPQLRLKVAKSDRDALFSMTAIMRRPCADHTEKRVTHGNGHNVEEKALPKSPQSERALMATQDNEYKRAY